MTTHLSPNSRLAGFALTASLFLLPMAGHAAQFDTVLLEKSTLGFGFKQMNVGMDGSFKKFAAAVNFDPAKPEAAKASLEVDISSIDTGSDEGDDEVAGKLWFDTNAFPTARFVSTSFKALGNNRYDITGQLSLKGRTLAVTAPTTVTLQGKTATFAGAFTIKRSDFAIGEGAWADFSTIANEIQIKFQVLAASGK